MLRGTNYEVGTFDGGTKEFEITEDVSTFGNYDIIAFYCWQTPDGRQFSFIASGAQMKYITDSSKTYRYYFRGWQGGFDAEIQFWANGNKIKVTNMSNASISRIVRYKVTV